jgi:hypothetical protein
VSVVVVWREGVGVGGVFWGVSVHTHPTFERYFEAIEDFALTPFPPPGTNEPLRFEGDIPASS